MGLLGSMVAGGVSGYAGSRMDTLEKKEAFDLKMELMNSETEKQMMLKREGIKLENEQDDLKYSKDKTRKSQEAMDIEAKMQAERDASNGVGGPGGYDPKAYNNLDEEGKSEFNFRSAIKHGLIDQGKGIEYDLTRRDKNTAAERNLEYKTWKSEQEGKYRDAILETKWRGLEIQAAKGSGKNTNNLSDSEARINNEITSAQRELKGVGYISKPIPKDLKAMDAAGAPGFGAYFTKPNGEKVTEFTRQGKENPEFADLKATWKTANKYKYGETEAQREASLRTGRENLPKNQKTTAPKSDTSNSKPKRSLSSFQQ